MATNINIGIDAGGLKGKELEAVVERDLQRFEAYLCSRPDVPSKDPLDKYEVSILKSYLWWKVNVDCASAP